jgi:hypothetical protein
MTRIPHPPFSSDLTRSDFWLFGKMKITLEGMAFNRENALRGRISAILADFS